MSENKRNVDTADLAGPSQGNASATGTGTHAANRVEDARENRDNKAKGSEGRKAGYGKGDTEP
jgi:hypothetical protein